MAGSGDAAHDWVWEWRREWGNTTGSGGGGALQIDPPDQRYIEYRDALRRRVWRREVSRHWLDVMLDIEIGVFTTFRGG